MSINNRKVDEINQMLLKEEEKRFQKDSGLKFSQDAIDLVRGRNIVSTNRSHPEELRVDELPTIRAMMKLCTILSEIDFHQTIIWIEPDVRILHGGDALVPPVFEIPVNAYLLNNPPSFVYNPFWEMNGQGIYKSPSDETISDKSRVAATPEYVISDDDLEVKKSERIEDIDRQIELCKIIEGAVSKSGIGSFTYDGATYEERMAFFHYQKEICLEEAPPEWLEAREKALGGGLPEPVFPNGTKRREEEE